MHKNVIKNPEVERSLALGRLGMCGTTWSVKVWTAFNWLVVSCERVNDEFGLFDQLSYSHRTLLCAGELVC